MHCLSPSFHGFWVSLIKSYWIVELSLSQLWAFLAFKKQLQKGDLKTPPISNASGINGLEKNVTSKSYVILNVSECSAAISADSLNKIDDVVCVKLRCNHQSVWKYLKCKISMLESVFDKFTIKCMKGRSSNF